MDDFDSWFPFDGTEDEEEKEMYREGFARCKLNLELGEYTGEELDYLYQIYNKKNQSGSKIRRQYKNYYMCKSKNRRYKYLFKT